MTVTATRARNQLSEVRVRNRFIFFFVVDIDIVESHKIEKARVIDDAQAEELADTRLGDAILELGQPTI